MTHGQQCACIWAITLPLHIAVGVAFVLLTSAFFSLDLPFRGVLSYVWMIGFIVYLFGFPMFAYNRIEDAWNRGRSLSRRS